MKMYIIQDTFKNTHTSIQRRHIYIEKQNTNTHSVRYAWISVIKSFLHLSVFEDFFKISDQKCLVEFDLVWIIWIGSKEKIYTDDQFEAQKLLLLQFPSIVHKKIFENG